MVKPFLRTPPALHRETMLVHGGLPPGGEGEILPPVHLSTAFAAGSAEAMEELFLHRREGPVYSRLGNPTVEALEARITALCGGRGTLAVASGMSAVALAVLALARAGDQVLVGRKLFGGTFTWFDATLRGLGVEPVWVDAGDAADAAARVTPRTRAVFLEAIANPSMLAADLTGYRALCDREGLPLIVDATLLTPLRLGDEACRADVWVFSGSKYLAGPASTIGGLVVDSGRCRWARCLRLDWGDLKREGDGAFLAKLRRELMASLGPALSPHTAFLQLLGLETLELRLQRQAATALHLARWLADRAAVTRVWYPGLAGDPGHPRCLSQWGGYFGTLVSFALADRAACFRFLNTLRLVRLAPNLGDTKTLALHPASTIYCGLWPDQREALGVPETMIRLSAGLEHPDDLTADLEQALAA